MILYLDTSACIKKYFRDNDSHEVIDAWKAAALIGTSEITYAETIATLFRRKREDGVSDRILSLTIKNFHADWESFLHISVAREINERTLALERVHPLTGFGAIHLASALIVAERVPDQLVFACYDKRLSHAAQEEGLELLHLQHNI